MFPKEMEVILMRQLASYLAMPIFIVDPVGTLVFYNEPAEDILGLRFEETGPMTASEWSTIFTPTDDVGNPLHTDDLPLTMALAKRRPTHGNMRIRGMDGIARHIEVNAFHLLNGEQRLLGAVAIFWEIA